MNRHRVAPGQLARATEPEEARVQAWRQAAGAVLRAAAADLDGRPEAGEFWRLAEGVEGGGRRPGG